MKPAQRDFLEAMLKIFKEGTGTDAFLVCQGFRKPVHTTVLLARSPSFFEAQLKRWSGEKREVMIEDCDPEVLDIVVNYMYGMDIPNLELQKIIKVLDIAEMLLMADLIAEVENCAIRILNKDNVKVLCAKADMYGCPNLLKACAQLMVKEEVSLSREEVGKMPNATVAYLEALKAELSQRKDLEVSLQKQQEEIEMKIVKSQDANKSQWSKYAYKFNDESNLGFNEPMAQEGKVQDADKYLNLKVNT